MSLQQLLAIAALAALPLAASAQEKDWNPADPNAPASQLRYESAFQAYLPANDEGDSPDKGWRAVNAALASQSSQQSSQQDMHAGHAVHGEGKPRGSMDGMPNHMHHMMPSTPAQAVPAAPEEWSPLNHSHHH